MSTTGRHTRGGPLNSGPVIEYTRFADDGLLLTWDASGKLTDRDKFANELPEFTFLALDIVPIQLFIKRSGKGIIPIVWDAGPKVSGIDVPTLGTAATKDVGNTAGTVADGKVVADLAGVVATKASVGHTAAPNANYQAVSTDRQVGFAVLTAARTFYLPDVDTFPMGEVLFVADESGQCSPDRPITVLVGIGTNDTVAGQPGFLLTEPYQGIGFRRGAANLWIIAR